MTVKEMIYAQYQVNEYNSCILSGNISHFVNNKYHFRVPLFQPAILQKVPSIDNGRILFPLNLPDFVYPEGIRVLTFYEKDEVLNSENK
jgi:hypothetical protein